MRVLVVAGDRLARAGLAATLEAEDFEVVGRLDPDDLGGDGPNSRGDAGEMRDDDPGGRADLADLVEAFDADVVVVDFGGPGAGADGDPAPGAMAALLDALIGQSGEIEAGRASRQDGEDGEGPVLVALVDDASGAARARSLGATAVLDREIHGEALAAALAAAAAGLVVASPALAEVLARAGLESGDPDLDRAGDPLTPREAEVLRHLADGRSNREIAHALSISPHTVKDHVDAILSKLGAASRTEAVVRAARSGLITI